MTRASEESPAGATGQHRWHTLHPDEAVSAIESDAEKGLSTDEAARRLERFGPNALREPKRRSLLSVFLHQFKSPLIYLLFAAAGIALALGHTKDAAVIFVVLLMNAVIGAFQEGRAERSLEALRKLATLKARVVRGGREILLDAHAVVAGDVLLLEAGDAVAADARLLDGAALQIAEAALTGESLPVGKSHLPVAPDAPLADRKSMVAAPARAFVETRLASVDAATTPGKRKQRIDELMDVFARYAGLGRRMHDAG